MTATEGFTFSAVPGKVRDPKHAELIVREQLKLVIDALKRDEQLKTLVPPGAVCSFMLYLGDDGTFTRAQLTADERLSELLGAAALRLPPEAERRRAELATCVPLNFRRVVEK